MFKQSQDRDKFCMFLQLWLYIFITLMPWLMLACFLYKSILSVYICLSLHSTFLSALCLLLSFLYAFPWIYSLFIMFFFSVLMKTMVFYKEKSRLRDFQNFIFFEGIGIIKFFSLPYLLSSQMFFWNTSITKIYPEKLERIDTWNIKSKNHNRQIKLELADC